MLQKEQEDWTGEIEKWVKEKEEAFANRSELSSESERQERVKSNNEEKEKELQSLTEKVENRKMDALDMVKELNAIFSIKRLKEVLMF